MQREAVRSSNIRSVGYDPETAVLEIEFHSGSVYQYLSVPPDIHASFMQAASKGKFLTAHIKNRFPFRQVR